MKIPYIDGEIPTINSKTVKMLNFSLLNRKTSAYIPPTELYSAV